MKLRKALGVVLLNARNSVGLTQEDFCSKSHRTYVSRLERGLSSPTVDKLDELATKIGIHPVSILFQTYVNYDEKITALDLMTRIIEDIKKINNLTDAKSFQSNLNKN